MRSLPMALQTMVQDGSTGRDESVLISDIRPEETNRKQS